MAANSKELGYPLEQSEEEMRRLTLQADVLHTEATRWLFHQAGLKAGMRVLDVGCGAGDVSLLAAEMVGRGGAVVGIDSSPRALETARGRVQRAGLSNCSFVEGDLRNVSLEGDFDALVGRSVLMYLPDPAATLRSVLASVRPGGVVAFREVLASERFLETFPRCDLIDRFNSWYEEYGLRALEAMGMDGSAASRLHQIFQDAGLPAPHQLMHAPIGAEPDWPGWQYLGLHVQMFATHAARFGVPLPPELDPTTFVDRVRIEVLKNRGVLRLQRCIQAWALKPSPGG